MKLISVHVTKYRSAEDSGVFTVEPDVTCLVGKNESGKTNILQALLRLNPAQPTAALDEVLDYPARLTRERRDAPAAKQIPVVVATFRYDQVDVDEIERELGPGALVSREFTVTKGYRQAALMINHRWDEKIIARSLSSQVELPPAAAATVTAQESLSGLLGALEALPEAPQAAPGPGRPDPGHERQGHRRIPDRQLRLAAAAEVRVFRGLRPHASQDLDPRPDREAGRGHA